ncbi:MAG: radical SAM protein [Candidatus Sericytochromatia bacterium]|nr:radical SAM protein [Candidatus Sericytochromatia bacterium]
MATTYFDDVRAFAANEAWPLWAIFELTYRCNFDCVHCYCVRGGGKPELTTEECKRTIDQMADFGVLFLTFSGGEIFLRPDFMEIARHAQQRRFSIRLFTNGSLITPAKAADIASLHPEMVEISLYGASEETYEAVMGHGKMFGAVMKGIENLLANGVRVMLKLPLLRENVHEADAIQAIADGFGCRLQVGSEMTFRDDGNRAPLGHQLPPAELKVMLRKFGAEPADAPRSLDSEVCTTGKSMMVLSPYGDVYPCMQIKNSQGNVRTQDIADIWQNAPFLQYLRGLTLRDFSSCAGCSAVGGCDFCPGMALMETGDLLGHSTQSCNLTAMVLDNERSPVHATV